MEYQKINQRQIFIQKIDEAKRELLSSGKIHAKDLCKHIRRMEHELMEYDQYRYKVKGGSQK